MELWEILGLWDTVFHTSDFHIKLFIFGLVNTPEFVFKKIIGRVCETKYKYGFVVVIIDCHLTLTKAGMTVEVPSTVVKSMLLEYWQAGL